jgi:hypothetical protein
MGTETERNASSLTLAVEDTELPVFKILRAVKRKEEVGFSRFPDFLSLLHVNKRNQSSHKCRENDQVI